jgi:Group II intron, maturase-specific domain
MRELKEVFRRHRSQPVERVISLINPVLRGWVNYFAVGHSSECFSFIKDWVEKRVRRHLAHAQKRKGFGWERWSRRWLYDTLRLFRDYRVRRDRPKVALAGWIGDELGCTLRSSCSAGRRFDRLRTKPFDDSETKLRLRLRARRRLNSSGRSSALNRRRDPIGWLARSRAAHTG